MVSNESGLKDTDILFRKWWHSFVVTARHDEWYMIPVSSRYKMQHDGTPYIRDLFINHFNLKDPIIFVPERSEYRYGGSPNQLFNFHTCSNSLFIAATAFTKNVLVCAR